LRFPQDEFPNSEAHTKGLFVFSSPHMDVTSANSLSLTRQQLFDQASTMPINLLVGALITVSDICCPPSSSAHSILQEIFQQFNAVPGPFPQEAIFIENLNPLSLRVRHPFSLLCVSRSNWMAPPFNRFSYQHIPVLHEVDIISKGTASVTAALKDAQSDGLCAIIDQLHYQSDDGTQKTFLDALKMTNTDSIVVAFNGNIVYERYFNSHASSKHIQFSVTKSVLALIVMHLIQTGVIDSEKLVRDYVPELEGSAFAGASIVDVLDMTTAIRYNEDYANPESDIARHLKAAGYISIPKNYTHPTTQREFLKSLKKEGEHGRAFHYVSANSEVLAWLVEKATGKTVNELFYELIWSKIGAEQDAYIIKDAAGVASWGGGLCATTRDMAKIGQLILENGKLDSKQLLSATVFSSMKQRDRREQFVASQLEMIATNMAGWSYKNHFWFTANDHHAFLALGIHAQMIYIDPVAKMVIAKNSSQPLAQGNPHEFDILSAVHALSKHLQSTDTKQHKSNY
jgi:CubicO group peptidase (beta-lactamase class C family)